MVGFNIEYKAVIEKLLFFVGMSDKQNRQRIVLTTDKGVDFNQVR